MPEPALPLWHAALLALPFAAFALAAFAVRGATPAAAWRTGRAAAGLALAAALGSVALQAAGGFADGAITGLGLRAHNAGALVLLLVALLGWVVVRYSQRYLAGQPREAQAASGLLATLAAVSAVVVSNHLLVLALAWMAASLALHRLLLFFGDRRPAVVAAHKKFVLGRVADIAMLGACALLAASFGTLQLDTLLERAAAAPTLPLAAHAAVLLVVLAAVLKCAQLPFHGWLIQVMEAPTPVSALLHAGVVNLGGFVLLLLAPLVARVPLAQLLLVLCGTLTAVVAALVMSTRISVKVALAWSTTAQMGFMLLQCGLGLWEMALLHLLAHSLYKAHAFLGAGGVVRRTNVARLAPAAGAQRAAPLALAALAGALLVALALSGAQALGVVLTPALAAMALIVAVALTPLLTGQPGGGPGVPVAGAGMALVLAGLYLALHAVFVHLVPPVAPPAWPLWVLALLGFAALWAVQFVLATQPQGPFARRAYPWFYGGLYLDERFSAALLSLLPPPARAQRAAATPEATR
jgi:NAD(P)H-quinone oxidoreductase subunit 5